jgi:hypothetical protein
MVADLQETDDWILLSTCVARMSELHPVYRSYPGHARDNLATAIRAGRISLRGRSTKALSDPPVSITFPINNNHRLDLVHNSLSVRKRGSPDGETLFREVEVEWTAAENYLRKLPLAVRPTTSEQQSASRPTRPPSTAIEKAAAQRRGRKPTEREEVKERMRADLQQGRCSKEDLRGMLQKNLVSKYGAGSRDTACKARDELLSEIAENSISNK